MYVEKFKVAEELLAEVRAGTRELDAYAWPGGYTIYYVRTEGGAVCPRCATRLVRRKVPIQTWGRVYFEGVVKHCASCRRRIESAYGDPEEEL